MSSTVSLKAALSDLGITDLHDVIYNPSYELLMEHETAPGLTGWERATLTASGAAAVDTGEFTGRSPRDKYIVRDALTEDTVWWSDAGNGRNDNKPLSPAVWAELRALVCQQLSGKNSTWSTPGVVPMPTRGWRSGW